MMSFLVYFTVLLLITTASSEEGNKCRSACTDWNGNNYAGFVNTDYMNFTCRHWAELDPAVTVLGTDDADFPCDNYSRVSAKNYCRAIKSDIPWCYTEFGYMRRSFCFVPRCEPPPLCFLTCASGPSYSGRWSVTRSGQRCKSWSSQMYPSKCTGTVDSNFPCDGSLRHARNFCRAPDGDPRGPWCYTAENSTAWDYCDIPQCDRNCGIRYVYPRLRIIGGNDAQQGEIPWQVMIMKRSQFGNWLFVVCGGTIVDEWWIVTAAHCFLKGGTGDFVIRVGALDNRRPDAYEQSFSIDVLIVHEHFKGESSLDNDIAMVRVKPVNGLGIVFSQIVQPACLATPSVFENVRRRRQGCIVSGWGFDSRVLPNVLHSATVPVIDHDACVKLHGGRLVTERMFCAGFVEGGVDACYADSGGPLVCRVGGRYTLIGITSWGLGCGRPNKPGVYTKVSQFHDWITTTIKNNAL